MGCICPEIFIFIRCIVRHLQYFLLLDSQPFPNWVNSGGCAFVATSGVFVDPILFTSPHPLDPSACGNFFFRRIFLGYHSGSQFIVCIYEELSTALHWKRACLALKCCSLFFGSASLFRVFFRFCLLLRTNHY